MRDYIFMIKHVYRVCILTLLQQSPDIIVLFLRQCSVSALDELRITTSQLEMSSVNFLS